MSPSRAGRLGLAELGRELAERDRAVVIQVGDLRLMSGRQIESIHFPADDYATPETAARCCRRALNRLVRERLLVRLPRQVGGVRGGSGAFVYGLGVVGHRLLHDDGSRLRVHEPGGAFVEHQLQVTQLVVDLTLAARSARFELLQVEGEPSCWRKLPEVGSVVLRPDLFLVVAAAELEYRWFVEVDRGTHRAPALLRKARLYERYYRSGVEQAAFGVSPRVLWITADAFHAERLRELFSRDEFTTGLMLVTTAARAEATLRGGEA